MREQSIVLEHEGDVAPVQRRVGDGAPVEPDAACVRGDDAGDDPQLRGLAATRGPKQGEELAVGRKRVGRSDWLDPSSDRLISQVGFAWSANGSKGR
jgi:hypothetical protein